MNAEIILETLGVWAATSSAILILAWLGTLSVRKNAALRHMIWATAFVLLLLSPVFAKFVPGRIATVVPTPVVESSVSLPADIPIEALATTEEPTKPFNWQPIITGVLGLWALGTILILGKAALGIKQANTMRKQGNPGDPKLLDTSEKLGLKRAWELRVSSTKRPPAAMTWGSFRPVVILPQASTEWDEKRTDTVLLHELSHVCRYDSLTQLLALVICAVYWFNPLVWLAARALRADAEQAADDRVIRAGVKPSDYAEELLRLAAEFGQQRQPLTHIGVSIMKQSQIETRILSIVDPSKRRRGVARLEGFSVVTVGLVAALSLVSLRPAMAQVNEQTPPPTPPRVEEKQVPPTPPAVVKEYPVEVVIPLSRSQSKKPRSKKQLPKRATKVKEVPVRILPPRERAITYTVETPVYVKGKTQAITFTTHARYPVTTPKVAYSESSQGLTYTRVTAPLKYSVVLKPTYATTTKYRVESSKVQPNYTVTTRSVPYKVAPPSQTPQDREKQEEKARQDQIRDKKAAEEKAQNRNKPEEQKRNAEAEISMVQAKQDQMSDQQRREAELVVVRAKQNMISDQERREVELAVARAQKAKKVSDQDRRKAEVLLQKALAKKGTSVKGKMTREQQRKAEVEVRALKEQLAKRDRDMDQVIAEKRQLELELMRAKQAKGGADKQKASAEAERERLMKLEKERVDIARAAKAEKERRDREEAAKNKKKDGGS